MKDGPDVTDLEYNDLCFACGRDNPHGLGMRISYTEDQAVCRLSLPARFQGWAGMAHGGEINAMLDEIMAYAVIHFVAPGVTASMETRFRRPTPLETELVARGWVVERKPRLALARGTIALAGDDRPLAEASAKFYLPRKDD